MRVPIKTSRYWPHAPHVKQAAFLALPHRESLYGGAAGGGKSDALLMAALQYVEVPGYSAILFRRTFPDLKRADGLITRSLEWLKNTDATYNANDHRWTFPSGATIEFAGLQHDDDRLKYQGAAYHFVGFDELTQFTEAQYTYVAFSRRRRTMLQKARGIPLRVRAGANPGGPGHEWVRDRFGLYWPDGEDRTKVPMLGQRRDFVEEHDRVFIPARVLDNPSLDAEDYISSLQELDHVTRRQLLDGDWDARPPGDLFRREWFQVVDHIPEGCRWVRFWDLAATEKSETNPDPDWTAGLLLGRHPNGEWFVKDVQRFRKQPGGVKSHIQSVADGDGRDVMVRLEQEPGSSGKTVVDDYVRNTLVAHSAKGHKSTGSKFARAQPVSAKAEHGLIRLLRGPWINAFLDELEAFGEDDKLYAHDDQVDALSGAFEALLLKGDAVRTPYRTGHSEPVVKRGDLTLRGRHHIDK